MLGLAPLMLVTTALPLWDPTQLGSALVAWWDASKNVITSSGHVTTWKDRKAAITATAQANSLTQTMTNGQPAIGFTDGNNGMNVASNGNLQSQSLIARTWLSSFYTAGLPFAGAYPSVFYNQTYGQDAAYLNGQAGVLYVRNANGGPQLGVTSNASHCLIAQTDPNTLNYLDSLDGVNTTGTSYGTSSGGDPNMYIGYNSAQSGNGNPSGWYGTIQQIVAISRLVTTAEQQKLEGWESWYTGKNGSNLPSGHPYKSRAPLLTDP